MNCKQCNKQITSKNSKIFCCRSCAATYNNKLFPKRKSNAIISCCLNCGKETQYIKSTKAGKYCSNKCQGIHKFKTVTIPRVEAGDCRDSITQRKYLAAVRGYKCECCGLSEWQSKPISLHVDHIDGNADYNLPINIRLLCPNCHSQTDTFCSRNRKNTKRSTYNQRYRIRHIHSI